MTETETSTAAVLIVRTVLEHDWDDSTSRAVVGALARAGWLHDPSEIASGAKLTATEWGALVSASAQLEVDWHDDGDAAARRRYAALERARAKIRAAMVPSAAR